MGELVNVWLKAEWGGGCESFILSGGFTSQLAAAALAASRLVIKHR